MENKAATGRYVTSQTSVWWDIDSCPVPAGYDASLVGPSIHLALEKLGYRGPITITAVGKLKRTSEDVMRAISPTGITVKYGGLGCRSTCAELFSWQLANPAPATIMFISSPSVLKSLSHRLRSVPKEYNMLLAYGSSLPEKDPKLVTCAEWLWESLLKEAMCSDGKLEAKRQILMEEKRSKSLKPFNCTLCYSAWRSVEAFTTHLQGLDHEVMIMKQLASQGQHEQGTELELGASSNGGNGGVEIETGEQKQQLD
ncbi:unnamed protein product [Microthlaspi erraticum]|uniref:NYN domain-containing protein n=1 Tax=Microthlaspi erraticum TaxID=1685480 RepID=A0A6D2L763_9BRAS|nr:unnamed protein product [Microthlaspi erraticum]